MTVAEHKRPPAKARDVLAELVASGRATCSVEEAAEIWGIGRCTGYEVAESTFGAIRVGRKLRVSVPRLLRMLEIPLPDDWQPAGCASRCQCAETEPTDNERMTSNPEVGSCRKKGTA